jgi:hypothetical protein
MISDLLGEKKLDRKGLYMVMTALHNKPTIVKNLRVRLISTSLNHVASLSSLLGIPTVRFLQYVLVDVLNSIRAASSAFFFADFINLEINSW